MEKKPKKLTMSQLNRLRKYVPAMRTAVRSSWARYPGEAAVREMKAIWEEHTGTVRTMRLSCSDCILNLLKDLGTLYFAQRPKDLEETK